MAEGPRHLKLLCWVAVASTLPAIVGLADAWRIARAIADQPPVIATVVATDQVAVDGTWHPLAEHSPYIGATMAVRIADDIAYTVAMPMLPITMQLAGLVVVDVMLLLLALGRQPRRSTGTATPS